MILINELVKREIINDLESRDLLMVLESGNVTDVDDGLLDKGVTYEQIAKVRSELFSIPLYEKDIKIDVNIDFLSIEDYRKYQIVPLEFTSNTLSVGIVDPENEEVLKKIEDTCSFKNIKYVVYIISKAKFKVAIDDYFKLETARDNNDISYGNGLVLHDVNSSTANIGNQEITDISKAGEKLSDNINEESVDKIFDYLLYHAITENASDIHIEHLGEKVRVRYRIDGNLGEVMALPPSMHSSLTARVKIKCDMKLDEKRKPQDGRFSIRKDNHKIDFRVSSMPSYYGEKIVIRILDSYRGVKRLEDIGFSEVHLELIRKALQKPFGMILISGPTGSGKTTTLYSMINEIDRQTRNVVSLEDPIEYNVPSMNQSQIFPEIGYTFASGLRSILRQDPDVIMVGEIRDSETAELAIQAALTGHLVFSTIHTNNSIGVITRLIDMGVDPFLIAPTLCLSIAQRLVPKIYPKCESPIEMTEGVKGMVMNEFSDLPDEFKNKLDITRPLYEAVPSSEAPSGTKGRMPVLEILDIDNDIQEAIIGRKSEEQIWAIARSKGMISMKEDAILKSMNGVVPFVEINGL